MGTKQLSKAEFKEFLKAAELGPDTADLAFAIFDNDKSGKIDFEEFVEFILYEALAETAPRAYFQRG
jgi:Ca2+-binding EF-hand superfamily protein